MPVSSDIVVTFKGHTAPIDVSLLLRLIVLRNLKPILNFNNGLLISIRDYWRVILVHKYEQLYGEWSLSVHYKEKELKQIYRLFYHPSTGKLLALILL